MNFLLFLLFTSLSQIAFGYEGRSPTSEELAHNQRKLVTYSFSGGRFGDRLLSYIHAKWISYYHGIPLLYKPFIYSDQLVLHKEERSDFKKKHLRPITPKPNKNMNYNGPGKFLYTIPYFPESTWELTKGNTSWYHFCVDWKNEGFRQELKRLIHPLYLTSFLDIPIDCISVALHIREGGGFDHADVWTSYPMKFPPQTYYIEQLRKISELFPNRRLYAHIFTDHSNPKELVEGYKQNLKNLDIEFGYREAGNSHSSYVLEDFFEMMRFDCLIMPDSNFSMIPAKMGDYKVVIRPIDFTVTKGIVYIDKVNVEISTEH